MSPSSERPQSPAVSERTHLLAESDATSLRSSRTSVSDDLENLKAQNVITPIPKKQLGVLFSIRFTEPIIYSHLWPYINQFVNDIGIADDPKNVGFYSGMIESVFAFGEVCSIFVLSRLSDKVGRRPVLLPSALGIALFTALFGLSTSFTMMLILRICGGLLAGATPIVHSIVSELTDETNNALVVPLYGLITPIGFAIGPLIGGTLEHAASKYPDVFGYEFFRKYPYFLPSFVPCCLAVVGVIFGYFFLEETLPSKVSAKKKAERRRSSCSSSSAGSTLYGATDIQERDQSEETTSPLAEVEEGTEPRSIKSLIQDPAIRAIMTSGTFLMFTYSSFDVLFSLYSFTAIEDGGVGLPPDKIGYAFSVAGLIAMLVQLCITPWVLRTFDKAKVYNFCMATFPAVFAFMACLNPIAQLGYDCSSKNMHPTTTALLYAAIGVLLLMARICVMAFPISMILIKQNADKHSLASANGLVQISMTVARAFAPTVSSSLFAFSTSHNILGGRLWVIITICISLVGIQQSSNMMRVCKKQEP